MWERWQGVFVRIGPPEPLPADSAKLWEDHFHLRAIRKLNRCGVLKTEHLEDATAAIEATANLP